MRILVPIVLILLLCVGIGLTAYGFVGLATSARAEPEPCALPAVEMPAEIQLHGADSVTQAMLESAYGAELLGGAQ